MGERAAVLPKGNGMIKLINRVIRVVPLTLCLGFAFALTTGPFTPVHATSNPAKDVRQGRSLDEAKKFVTELAQHSISILQRTDQSDVVRQREFERVWSKGVAFSTIGRFVLGRHWRAATPDQRIRYQELFVASVMRTSINVLGGLGHEQLRIIDARLAGKKDILISTLFARSDGPAISVDWRVRKIDERNQIVDVVIEGVSMVLTKRSEFSAVVKNEGFEGLLAALNSRI